MNVLQVSENALVEYTKKFSINPDMLMLGKALEMVTQLLQF